jgi:peptide deformylase
MAILPIRTFGDPVLRIPTARVTDIDEGVRKLVADMIETMYDAPGVGLAATQIGVSRRVCVFDANDGHGAQVLINGEIVETDGELLYDEGCLSVPGHWWEIARPEFARARGSTSTATKWSTRAPPSWDGCSSTSSTTSTGSC